MALKFKPVVVTAVLISVIYFKLDPLFSVKKNYGPVRLLRTCFSRSEVLLS